MVLSPQLDFAGPVIVTAPTERPITVAEFKTLARVLSMDEDSLIDDLIKRATKFVEHSTNRQLVTATLKVFFPAFADELRLPRPPLQASPAPTVKYVDTDGVTQTLAATEYQIDSDFEPGRIKVANGKSWPAIRSTDYNAVEVQYTAGYGVASAVPDEFKQMVLLAAAHQFEFREPISNQRTFEVPMALRSMIDNNKFWMY